MRTELGTCLGRQPYLKKRTLPALAFYRMLTSRLYRYSLWVLALPSKNAPWLCCRRRLFRIAPALRATVGVVVCCSTW